MDGWMDGRTLLALRASFMLLLLLLLLLRLSLPIKSELLCRHR
jgi:hypothetical protein